MSVYNTFQNNIYVEVTSKDDGKTFDIAITEKYPTWEQIMDIALVQLKHQFRKMKNRKE